MAVFRARLRLTGVRGRAPPSPNTKLRELHVERTRDRPEPLDRIFARIGRGWFGRSVRHRLTLPREAMPIEAV
jgi:hypothetical protein